MQQEQTQTSTYTFSVMGNRFAFPDLSLPELAFGPSPLLAVNSSCSGSQAMQALLNDRSLWKPWTRSVQGRGLQTGWQPRGIKQLALYRHNCCVQCCATASASAARAAALFCTRASRTVSLLAFSLAFCPAEPSVTSPHALGFCYAGPGSRLPRLAPAVCSGFCHLHVVSGLRSPLARPNWAV